MPPVRFIRSVRSVGSVTSVGITLPALIPLQIPTDPSGHRKSEADIPRIQADMGGNPSGYPLESDMEETPIERRRRLERERKARKRREDPDFYQQELIRNRERGKLRQRMTPRAIKTPEMIELENRLRELKSQAKKRTMTGKPCAICDTVPRGERRLDVLHLDHDHKTGQFRGWLCRACNLAIGHLKDDPLLCERAAAYLKSTPSPQGHPLHEHHPLRSPEPHPLA